VKKFFLEGEKFFLEGEKFFLEGEKFFLEGEKFFLEGEKFFLEGEKVTTSPSLFFFSRVAQARATLTRIPPHEGICVKKRNRVLSYT
jgi:hypothetical protein